MSILTNQLDNINILNNNIYFNNMNNNNNNNSIIIESVNKNIKKGYAKLKGPSINEIYIIKLKAILGRENKKTEEEISNEYQFISLGNSNQKISRQHILIYWDDFNKEWYLKNISKNCISVNKHNISNKDDAICISPISAIQIDDINFYFCQSKK